MLTALKLTNFRCFADHEFEFGPLNITVGHNNAGKSTLAEALRFVSIASARLRTLNFREPPSWLVVPKSQVGGAFSLQQMQVDFDRFYHRYSDPPAMIRATFDGGAQLRIYIGGPNRIHCVVSSADKVLRTREAVKRVGFPRVETLPQVGPVAAQEIVLNPDYVQGALSSRLAPIHFRNQLNLLHDDFFRSFQETVEATWPGLQVTELDGARGKSGTPLYLQVRDGDFVGEVSTMGHGVQMWLQTIWFLVRSKVASTIILDEPDVYMHADLQRKLVRHLRSLGKQVILTTHSTEIMSEVSPEDVVVVDRTRAKSRAADSLPAVQRILSNLGSAHNVHLFRLWSARRFLQVEGDDIPVLQAFQNVVQPASINPIAGIPSASFGGWGGWKYALGSARALSNAAGAVIATYCILDSDYHVDAQIDEVKEQFDKHGVHVHVWARKELENYLLDARPIARVIAARAPRRVTPPSEGEVQDQLEHFANELENDAFDGYAQELLSHDRSLGAGGANKAARQLLAARKARLGLLGCVSGKSVLQRMFDWVQKEVGVSLNSVAIASAFEADEVPEELRVVLSAIEDGHNFAANDTSKSSL